MESPNSQPLNKSPEQRQAAAGFIVGKGNSGKKGLKPILGRNFLVVVLEFAAVILVLFLLAAFALAKSGVVSVPVFSSFYSGPEAAREITASPLDPQAFKAIISRRFLDQLESGKPPYLIKLSDEEITGSLESVIDMALRDASWQAQKIQLISQTGHLEMFVRFKRGVWKAEMRVRLKPIVENGGARFEVIDFRFGDYPIHPKLAKLIAGWVFSRDFGTWILRFGDIELSRVNLTEGTVELYTSPAKP